MNALRLLAQDEEDLKVVSAHLQDAELKTADIAFLPKAHRFALVLNCYCWDCEDAGDREGLRVQAGLHFDGVLSVQTQGLNRANVAETHALLAIDFIPGLDGTGTIMLLLGTGGAIKLDVECIDATLSDMGGAWPAPCPRGAAEAGQ